MKKLLSILILFTFFFTQTESVVFAEDSGVLDIPKAVDANILPIEIGADTSIPPETVGTSIPVAPIVNNLENTLILNGDVQASVPGTLIQDTVNTQLSSEIVNPNLNNSAEIVPPIDVVNTEPNPGEVVIVKDEPVEIVPPVDEEVSPPAEEIPAEIVPEPEVVPILDEEFIVFKKPKPIYSFSVSSRKINTKKKEIRKEMRMNFKNSKKGVSESVDVATEVDVSNFVTPVMNEEKGTMDISGSCSNVYYVVLLYKTEQDYKENPSSYIYNKAFNCTDNSYTYSISDLPEKLENGPYYLLIGEQGDKGTWTPSTGLTEININRN